MPESLIVRCSKCSQKIALPYGFDSQVFICPKCQHQMATPAQVFTPQDRPQQAQTPPEPSEPPSIKSSSQQTSHISPTNPPQAMPTDLTGQKEIQPKSEPEQKTPAIPEPENTPAANGLNTAATHASSVAQSTPNLPPRKTYPSKYPKATAKPPSPKKKSARAQLVEKVGDLELTEHIQAWVQNSISPQPESKEAFMRRLVKNGMDAQTAAALIAYAENSEEGKQIALGTSWTTFYYGLAALVGGTIINAITIYTTGYVVKALGAIPMIGFLVVVNSGQKILSVNFPIFNNQLFQLLIFIIFLGLMGGGFYLALR
jgi:hypothetical protein